MIKKHLNKRIKLLKMIINYKNQIQMKDYIIFNLNFINNLVVFKVKIINNKIQILRIFVKKIIKFSKILNYFREKLIK